MKTKYPTIRFRRDAALSGRSSPTPTANPATWRCHDSEDNVLGDVVKNRSTGEWRFLTLGSVFLDARISLDIADFLDQLNKEKKPQ